MKKWEQLPPKFQNDSVKHYYDILKKRTASLIIKRIFDIILGLILTVIALPFMLIIAVWIKCDSKGKVFFLQRRVTTYGRVFHIFKFRTMVSNAEKLGTQVTVQNDSRVTKAGKFLRKCRLDELPQLFNVLKGDMSFIGPRPLLVKYLPLYSPEQMRRHEVRPGISGWAQVNGRNTITFTKQFEYDVYYVDHLSFWLDVKIFFMTILKVFKREGISEEGQATRETFNGSN